VKRLVTIVTPAILLAALVLFGSSDAGISSADTSISTKEVASNEANNASVTIL